MKLVVATHNQGKLAEFRRMLATLNVEILSATEAGISEFPPENGTTYAENALLKAGYATLTTGLPALADDSGLEVDILSGAPGIFSARYGGKLDDGERIAYLLDQLKGIPKGARGASFVCAVVIATPAGEVKVFHGECRGEILQGPRGSRGFGYDPIFYSLDLTKSFAEAGDEEKQRVSHRGRALQHFLDWALTPAAKTTMSETMPRRDGKF